jgi:Lon protease-like protein
MKVTSTRQLLDYLAAERKRAAESAEELREVAKEVAAAIPAALDAYRVPANKAADLRDEIVGRLRSLAASEETTVLVARDATKAIETLVTTAKAHKPESAFHI